MSIYSNIRDRYYIYRIQKNSDFFRTISNPSFNLVAKLMNLNAALIKTNRSIGFDVMQGMVSKDYNSIKYFFEPDKRLVWQAAMKNPEILRSLELDEGQQMYLYEQNHKVYDYINRPSEMLQKTVILDDWHKVLNMQAMTPSTCSAFLSSTFGINGPVTPEIQDAVSKLITDWKIISEEYHGRIEFSPDTEQMFVRLRSKGITWTPDYLKDNICSARYKNSIIEFQKTTGLRLSEAAPAFQETEVNDPLRTKALLEGVKNRSAPSLSSRQIYNSCADKIIRLKSKIEGSNLVTRQQLDNILGKKEADNLVSVLEQNEKSLSDITGNDVVNLMNKGTTTLADKTLLQKVSGPAGYAMQAYKYMESMSSLGQCEM